MKFNIPIGPQHPALKEPISLRMTVEGEVIRDADLRLGYNHRGLEKAGRGEDLDRRTSTSSSASAASAPTPTRPASSRASRSSWRSSRPGAALYIRYLVSELERVHSHLLWLGVAGHEAGFDTFFMYTWRDREVVMDLLEMISGNRVHYAMNTIGGVRRDLDEAQIQKILDGRRRPRTAERILLQDRRHRADVRRPAGRRRLPDARRRRSRSAPSVRRPAPRASRRRPPGRPLRRLRRGPLRRLHGRLVRRPRPDGRPDQGAHGVLQDLASISSRTCRRATIAVKAPKQGQAGRGRQPLRGAPRREHPLHQDPTARSKPERLKVRAPTLANYPATIEMLKNGFIADIPLIFAAIDPCICCTERTVELVDARSGAESVHPLQPSSGAGRRAVRHNPPVKRNAVWPF